MFLQQKKLPSVEDVKKALPLSEELKLKKLNFDEHLKQNILTKKQFVVVCGPCSADNPKAVFEYVTKLKELTDNFPSLLVVARVYTTKPRSNGVGYKGLCFGIDGKDISQGVYECRKMMIECLKVGLPIADELLYPELYHYFDDLVSYYFVGARSNEDALHRAFASGLDVCCGVKNSTDGDVEKLTQSLLAVSTSTVFPFDGNQIATEGNKYCHGVLRGGYLNGAYSSNLTDESIDKLAELLKTHQLQRFIMADLGHANSQKVAQNQIENAKMVISNKNVNGVMFESYLFDGTSDCEYGVSKTDECLSWQDTVKLIKLIDEKFRE